MGNFSESKLMNLPYFVDKTGGLSVIEGGINMPFDILRVFTVSAPKDAIRGDHAHKKCSQFMVCVSGVIEIICDNGIEETIYQLDSPSIGLNVEPGIWAKEKYLTENAVLMVLCDMPYKNEDYIRDYNEFIIYKKSKMEKK
jgi:dTDP-4-dehydrorhamnose 3,5-epimerase-like enzyme